MIKNKIYCAINDTQIVCTEDWNEYVCMCSIDSYCYDECCDCWTTHYYVDLLESPSMMYVKRKMQTKKVHTRSFSDKLNYFLMNWCGERYTKVKASYFTYTMFSFTAENKEKQSNKLLYICTLAHVYASTGQLIWLSAFKPVLAWENHLSADIEFAHCLTDHMSHRKCNTRKRMPPSTSWS